MPFIERHGWSKEVKTPVTQKQTLAYIEVAEKHRIGHIQDHSFSVASRNDAPDIAKALDTAMEWLREDTGRNHPAHCICLRCETVLKYFGEVTNG
jgi:hypothetical protein